ncbi:MAG: DUF1343 domain-containing protein [Bacteroidota bacterium]|nr:DUF1343 domain-containing protein [Bacteroidota bacterium]
MRIYKIYTLFLVAILSLNAGAQGITQINNSIKTINDVQVGADRTQEYLPLLKNKSVAIVANQSSNIKNTHLVDSLVALGINVKKVFCPEHGFRGLVDAGKKVKTYKDIKTGLPIISLYGKNKKPAALDLKDVDVLIFDIQDVGVRFYTYLSTLHYVMEACAENNKTLIVLDRPNPNGYYIDGPVMEDAYKSFLGLHPVPIVYGLTIGEYAQMINGEAWLTGGLKCNLKVILLNNYTHSDFYELPVRPSPNLPNMASVYLYPSLGLFEGTIVSVGRGTDLPFQIIGHPTLQKTNYTFTPKPKGGAMEPKYNGQVCNGYNLFNFGTEYMKNTKKIYLYWLINTYKNTPDNTSFFDENFNYHAGNATLQKQIKENIEEEAIRKSWQPGLENFKTFRKKYLLYKDFE